MSKDAFRIIDERAKKLLQEAKDDFVTFYPTLKEVLEKGLTNFSLSEVMDLLHRKKEMPPQRKTENKTSLEESRKFYNSYIFSCFINIHSVFEYVKKKNLDEALNSLTAAYRKYGAYCVLKKVFMGISNFDIIDDWEKRTEKCMFVIGDEEWIMREPLRVLMSKKATQGRKKHSKMKQKSFDEEIKKRAEKIGWPKEPSNIKTRSWMAERISSQMHENKDGEEFSPVAGKRVSTAMIEDSLKRLKYPTARTGVRKGM